jgi:hypothetical protein
MLRLVNKRIRAGAAGAGPAGARHVGARSIVVSRKPRRPARGDDDTALLSWVRDDSERRARTQEIEYKRKLEDIRGLTRQVASMVKRRAAASRGALPPPSPQGAPPPSPPSRGDADAIYAEIQGGGGGPGGLVLPSSVDLPAPVLERLGPAVRYLVTPHAQNWDMLLAQLDEAGGLHGLTPRDVRRLVRAIPPQRRTAAVRARVERMMAAAAVERTSKFVDMFLEGLILAPEGAPGGAGGAAAGRKSTSIAAATLAQCEALYRELKAGAKHAKVGRSTLELMVKASGKAGSLERVNFYLAEMKRAALAPLRETLANVLACCVYRARDHRQATQIFELMKFVSQLTRPGTRQYQDMIVSLVSNADDVERALDLYREMEVERIAVNQQILVALARGCTRRAELKLKAWEFLFEVYERGWEPALETYEYTMLMAANDGDVALARALYAKLCETRSATPRAFLFLMLAYLKPLQAKELPTVAFSAPGRKFRNALLADTRYGEAAAAPQWCVPFLPRVELATLAEVMAESSAVWAHTLMFHRGLVTPQSTDVYLKVAAEHGTLAEFELRWAQATFLDGAAVPEGDTPQTAAGEAATEASAEPEGDRPQTAAGEAAAEASAEPDGDRPLQTAAGEAADGAAAVGAAGEAGAEASAEPDGDNPLQTAAGEAAAEASTKPEGDRPLQTATAAGAAGEAAAEASAEPDGDNPLQTAAGEAAAEASTKPEGDRPLQTAAAVGAAGEAAAEASAEPEGGRPLQTASEAEAFGEPESDRHTDAAGAADHVASPEHSAELQSAILEPPESASAASAATSITTSPLLHHLTHPRVARTTRLYITALQAAGRFEAYAFGQRIWQERGQYRKSAAFTAMTRATKDREDFEFAVAMVSALTKMGMLQDALAVVVSTEYQFRWSRKELSELYHAAADVGDDTTIAVVLGITSRALVKWEGKIRRRDFKRYTMERKARR